MATPEELMRQAEAVSKVRVARINCDRAEVHLRAEIHAALDTGASVKDVAVAAGRTPSRIYQIINEDRGK